MTGEEMERALEFLLQSQANYDARLEQTKEFLLQSQANYDARLEQTNARLEQTNARLEQTSGQIAETSRQLQAYAETQTEFIQIVTTSISRLVEAQTRSDERIDKLTALLERFVSEGKDGKP
jgi:ABC-type transporter Mla subunit MlaD